ncbi:MAG: hypothetical protein UT63_C0003G0053 [Candidatus Gottesmanbacteria bacterium GW2011_GWC2_39_8]|uniref:Uncharacterized protein n=1 Tax=Candidatus Gottesmanbacteria bacterium GW2011_GWC2_39_8 TaxID=1618450 RepID=A0A0G0T8Z5_9BACT|nr:MAG: hypothetical protein UT63_C0003G0053 [Candidatus Gottesmanbacteria bacterium GW2011_GWC2_39_8]
MKKSKSHHLIAYLILIFILLSGLFFFLNFQGVPRMQIEVAVITSVFYALWGIVHHLIDRDLHPKIVVEYILIGLIAVILIKGVLIH